MNSVAKWIFSALLACSLCPSQVSALKLESIDRSRVNSWGYVDGTGRFRLPTQFSSACAFREGFACVKRGNAGEEAAFINVAGKALPLRRFYYGENYFSNGLAKVYSQEEHGYVFVDSRNRAIGGTFASAYDFNDGLARVSVSIDTKDLDGLPKNCDGVINTDGKYVVKPIFDDSMWQFSEGLLAVRKAGKWGFIDDKGHFLIPLSLAYARNFHNDRAIVMAVGSRKYAYSDRHGNLINMDQYDQISDFREGLAPVCKKGKWGYVNTHGELTIPCKFDKCGLFQEGLAAVVLTKSADHPHERIGFIDKLGKQVIPFQFVDTRGGFAEGLAAVAIVDKSRPNYYLYGYIDHAGTWKIKPMFDDARPFSEGLAAVCQIDRKHFPNPKQEHLPPDLFVRRDEFTVVNSS